MRRVMFVVCLQHCNCSIVIARQVNYTLENKHMFSITVPHIFIKSKCLPDLTDMLHQHDNPMVGLCLFNLETFVNT